MIASADFSREDSPASTYLPARMLNEFVYCPRLFYYEWVEGIFVHNQDTLDGVAKHARVDAGTGALKSADELAASDEKLHSRSVTLSSETHQLIAKLDLVEADGNVVTPVDYKRGRPCENRDTGAIEAWEADRIQVGVQAIVLRDNGYEVREAVLYYAATRQRVRIAVDEALISATLLALKEARELATRRVIPPPLIDSPKCPRCSLVGICLPDETSACLSLESVEAPQPRQRLLFDLGASAVAKPMSATESNEQPVRRLVPARDDLRPLYLNSQGLNVGKSGHVLKVKEKDKVVQEVRILDICQLNLFGNIQVSTQAIQTLCEQEIPIAYFSQGAWFYGVTHGLGIKNIFLRREQFRLADVPSFALRLAKGLVAGKIRNQRTMLQRNHIEPPPRALAMLKACIEQADATDSLETLLGIEGNAARIYFENFNGLIKTDDRNDQLVDPLPSSLDPPAPTGSPSSDGADRSARFTFDFTTRNRRPPRDPVNALLSLAYSLLAKDLHIVCHTIGLDPYLGFLHQPRFGRPALALDLMEPFRPLIADSAVLSAINTRMVTESDFVRAGDSVALTPSGRKAFFRAYEQRMDTLVTHPLFGYRVNYRRILEIQTRLLARVLTGELFVYPVFVTR